MSGSIWTHDDPPPPPPEDLYTGTMKLKSDIIESAREGFAKEADRLKQELMKLLGIVSESEDIRSGKILEAAAAVCGAVFRLSLDLTNETERDMYVICDLLAISLAATVAEKSNGTFEYEKDIPYLSKAFAVLCNKNGG